MLTRPLGPDAPTVSAFGFGGMPLSTSGRPSESEAIGVIHAVLDRGITLLDTADVYSLDNDDIGHNERLIAKVLKQWGGGGGGDSDKSGLVVATKGGMIRPGGGWDRDARPERLREACERSLVALDVDCIDLYQLHTPDPAVPFEESVGALARLRDEGKIRWVGLSNVSVAEIETARGIVPIQTVQNRLNPFFREAIETGVVAHCAEAGLGFLAYSPVGGGRLNKKLPGHSLLHDLATRHGVSTHAVVLAWVAGCGDTVFPIPAARTMDHALDSLTAIDLELSPADVAAIDAAEFSRA